jgi:RNA polymerase sigma factor for flagellar operon FliA
MDARETQIRELFPLVKKIARRIHRLVPGSDLDDLIGEGSVGLIRAVDSYDARRGASIGKYAARIVAGSMLNGMRRLDPVSERVRREVREAERERYTLANELGALPTQPEMEKRRPRLRRATMHAYRYTPLSLDIPLPVGERFAGDWNADPGSIAAQRSECDRMQAAVRRLTPRQQDVLALHYYGGKSLHQIGEVLSISPQRASQLHLAALRNLRKAMHGAR